MTACLLSVGFLANLGSVIDMNDKTVDFKKIPGLKVKLGKEPMKSVVNTATSTKHRRSTDRRSVYHVSSTFTAIGEHVIPPHTTLDDPYRLQVRLKANDQDFTFIPDDEFSPIIPGLLPLGTDQVTLFAVNETEVLIRFEGSFNVTLHAPVESILAQKGLSDSEKTVTDDLSAPPIPSTSKKKSTYTYLGNYAHVAVALVLTMFPNFPYTHKTATRTVYDVGRNCDSFEMNDDLLGNLNAEFDDHRHHLQNEETPDFLQLPLPYL